MTNFTATSTVNVYKTVEEAVAALETKLELIVNTAIVRTATVIQIEGGKYAAVIVWTTA